MPIPLQTRIDKLDTQMLSFGLDLNMASQHANALGMHLNLEGNPVSSTDAYALGTDLLRMYGHWQNSTDDIKDMLIWCLQYINDNGFGGGGGGVTMADILLAMKSASFEELTEFIKYTDAYDVATWESPFYEELYASAVRDFKTWGA